MIKPCGPNILVEIVPVEEKTKAGIVIASQNQLKREQGGRDIGFVRALGTTCYMDLTGIKADTPEDGARQWGYKVNDLVEFRRYDGKIPRLAEINEEYKNLRIVHDNDILCVYDEKDVEDVLENHRGAV
jgi:co-chaperonin GroES (HSP10)